MEMHTKPRLHQSLAFNLIVAVAIGVCFGAQPGVAQDPRSISGEWSTGPTWPFVSSEAGSSVVHAHLLPTGKVMIWPGDQPSNPPNQQPQSWDPANPGGSPSPLMTPGYNVFCSGHSLLADGRLFVAGGHTQNGFGLANASIFPGTGTPGTWTRLPDMPGPNVGGYSGRWYPTVTVLANGDVLVVSGSNGDRGGNQLPQVFKVGSGWRDLTSAVMGMDLYPQMFLAPNGKVFNSGPSPTTRYLDTAGTGSWSQVPLSGRAGPTRDYGSAVMYAPGKILVMGGGGGADNGPPPEKSAQVIDLNQTSPTWQAAAPMAVARRQLNATLLPNGTVLVTGGTRGPGFNNTGLDAFGLPYPVYAAELWDPATGGWTTLASSLPIPRVYHSTAVLLPDGRVLSMGGNGDPQKNSEIYSPPYLFNVDGTPATRPTIGSALPQIVAYGQTFVVPVTSDVTQIAKVTMLRLSSVTHAFNMSQYISTWTKGSSPSTLNFSQVAGGLNLRLPSAAAVESSTAPAVAPPGPYMLFILNGSGVPSEAKIVQLATLNSITVTPANPTIQTGKTQPFTATGTYSVGTPQDITTQVTWASLSTTVATINGSGLATAGASAGSTTISATLSGVTGSTTLTVQAAPAPTLTSIAVTPANPTIQTGTTQQFAAEGTYSDNSKQIITNLVAWASSNAAVATITTPPNGSGLATGVSAGSPTISATLSGVTGSTVLTVQASPAPLTITTSSLPNAKLGVDYKATSPTGVLVPVTLVATGGTPPYAWSFRPPSPPSPSPLPPGLSLTQGTGVNLNKGVIIGTPMGASTASPYRFTVQVSDSVTPTARTATKALTIKVNKR